MHLQQRVPIVAAVLWVAVLLGGCASTVAVQQPMPLAYATGRNIQRFEISSKPGVALPIKLRSALDAKMTAGIPSAPPVKSGPPIYLRIEIDKAQIADRALSTGVGMVISPVLGSVVGGNSLHGTVTAHDAETNKVVGKFRVDIDKNWGGASAFVNLEEEMAEVFVTRTMQALSGKPV